MTNQRADVVMSTEPVGYMERSRIYYAAQGYETAYEWSHYDDIPFTRLNKPLAECSATIVTTAMPDPSYADERRRLFVGDLGNPPGALHTGGLFWDKDATHTDDINSYFPAAELARRIAAGQVGSLSPHFYCLPTIYSQRRTLERDAPEIVESCLDDGVDFALLVPL